MNERLSRWGAPATYVAAVVVIGLTLIAILVRSPDTRANFQDSPEGYDRTELAVIGREDQFEGFITDLGSASTAEEVYFGAGCASCHGLRGEGAVVGPNIQKKNFEDLLDAVRGDEHGMPGFESARLTDEQVESVTAYLNALRETAQQ